MEAIICDRCKKILNKDEDRHSSVEVLSRYFDLCSECYEEWTSKVAEFMDIKYDSKLEQPLCEVVSVRSYRCIARALCKSNVTVGDVTNLSESQLRKIRNLGEQCMKDVKDMLKARGLHLKYEDDQNQDDGADNFEVPIDFDEL